MSVIALVLSFNCWAMTLADIERLAINRSSSLSAQEMESHALKSEANAQGKWQNPQFMSQIGTLKSGTMQGSTVEVSITQPVPVTNKYSLRKELADIATVNHKLDSEFTKNWISHQAVLAAWRVSITSELLKHGVERTKRLGLVEKYLKTRSKVTIKQRVELSIISSTLVQLEKMQDEKKHESLVAKSDLEFWIGKFNEDQLNLKIPEHYQFLEKKKIDTSKDLELAKAQNALKLSSLDRELASKERWPDVFLGGGYRIENVAPKNHFSYAILGLTIPLWDSGSNRVEAARVRERRDEKNLEEVTKRLFLKHQNQLELINFSKEQLKRFPKSFVRINESAIHEAETGFKQGLLDVNTFLLAETQTHEVIDQVFLSWMNYLENLSALQLMKGEKLNWGIN